MSYWDSSALAKLYLKEADSDKYLVLATSVTGAANVPGNANAQTNPKRLRGRALQETSNEVSRQIGRAHV